MSRLSHDDPDGWADQIERWLDTEPARARIRANEDAVASAELDLIAMPDKEQP